MAVTAPSSPRALRPRWVQARWGALLCVGLWLAAQGLLAGHEIEHLSEPDPDLCELCLIGAGVAGGVPAEVRLETPVAPLGAVPLILLCAAVARGTYRPQRARAPPVSIPISR